MASRSFSESLAWMVGSELSEMEEPEILREQIQGLDEALLALGNLGAQVQGQVGC